MEQVVQQTFQSILTEATAMMSVILPIGLGIFALPFGIKIAKRIFKAAV